MKIVNVDLEVKNFEKNLEKTREIQNKSKKFKNWIKNTVRCIKNIKETPFQYDVLETLSRKESELKNFLIKEVA